MRLTTADAVRAINKKGALLVFPIKNKKLPESLWSQLLPRKKMRWVWDESGDNQVESMWFLMKRLSDSRKVVYSKWYQGRATFFSCELFTAMLSVLLQTGDLRQGLSRQALQILEALESDSPLSTKQLKAICDLQGRLNEGDYNRAMRTLFQRQLIVAYGEVDDGAFPSLAVGATKTLFEDLWGQSVKMSKRQAESLINEKMPLGSLWRRQFEKVKSGIGLDANLS